MSRIDDLVKVVFPCFFVFGALLVFLSFMIGSNYETSKDGEFECIEWECPQHYIEYNQTYMIASPTGGWREQERACIDINGEKMEIPCTKYIKVYEVKNER